MEDQSFHKSSSLGRPILDVDVQAAILQGCPDLQNADGSDVWDGSDGLDGSDGSDGFEGSDGLDGSDGSRMPSCSVALTCPSSPSEQLDKKRSAAIFGPFSSFLLLAKCTNVISICEFKFNWSILVDILHQNIELRLLSGSDHVTIVFVPNFLYKPTLL